MSNPTNETFSLVQIYLVTAMFAHRGNQLLRPPATPLTPQKLGVSIELDQLNDGAAAQVRVMVSTDPADGDEHALYDYAVEMAGIVEGVNKTRFPDPMLVEVVATMVFPFIREAVANITTRGRFGTVWLNPFDVHSALQEESREVEQKPAQRKKQKPQRRET